MIAATATVTDWEFVRAGDLGTIARRSIRSASTTTHLCWSPARTARGDGCSTTTTARAGPARPGPVRRPRVCDVSLPWYRQRTMTPDVILSARKSHGMSQAALAAALGVRQPTISNWESGKTRPLGPQIERLRQVLGSQPTASQPVELAPAQGYGDWLSSNRADKALSRAELAAKSGVSQPQIFNIETGRTANPRPATRQKLERALGVNAPARLIAAVEKEAEIEDVGQFLDFDPADESDFPQEPGVYVFYDVSDRPVYVGESGDIGNGSGVITSEKFWYRTPIVEKAAYVRVDDQKLRRQLENTLIKFLKSNAVINRRQVDR